MNCPSSLDKTGKEGLSGITCPVACQSRVAPRPKSGLQAQCGGGLENPWLGTEWCVPLDASADRLHLALEHRRVHRFHSTLPARYRTGIEQRLSYEKLYQDAVLDPLLRRTRQELEVAVENSATARRVVSELFQDLEGFRLDDYRAFDDAGEGMRRLLNYVREGVERAGGAIRNQGGELYEVALDEPRTLITTNRDRAKEDEGITLLGLEHPLVRRLMATHRPGVRWPLAGRSSR